MYPACNRVIRFAGLLEPSHSGRQAGADAEPQRSAKQAARVRHRGFFHAERAPRHEPDVLRVVFLGVVQALIHSPIPDEIVWCVLWLALAIWSQTARNRVAATRPTVGRWRIVHGMTAALLCLYVAFHLANHLFGLIGPDAHAAVMKIGRVVYRSRAGEPLLVAAMLFQIGTGLFLAWRWSAAPQGFHRTFQVASGAYLSLYILGHMNSVFIYARSFLGIPTDWNFAIGAPTGLIHDAWNIRLLPHYALGVFFVLSHLASGLRVVLIAHGVDRHRADRLWIAGAATSAAISAAIMAGMCGVRIG